MAITCERVVRETLLKKANTTTSKCGGSRLGHFATKNTDEKVIQT